MFRSIAASSGYYNFAQRVSYMPILRGDAEISSSLRVTVSLFSGMSNGLMSNGHILPVIDH